MDDAVWKWVLQHTVQEASKLSVKAFIAGNKLVRKCKTWHKSTLLEPVNSTERSTEEDTLDRSKGHHALRKAVLLLHPLHSPLCLLTDRRHGVDGIEELLLFSGLTNILLNEK